MKFLLIILLAKTSLGGSIQLEGLRISTVEFEPFSYHNENGEIYRGIEFKIIQTVAQKLDRKLLYQKWHGYRHNFDQLLFK